MRSRASAYPVGSRLRKVYVAACPVSFAPWARARQSAVARGPTTGPLHVTRRSQPFYDNDAIETFVDAQERIPTGV
jgi:hypothetical protein